MTYRYFKIEEFACKCGCGTNLMSHAFVEKCDTLRSEYGKALRVNSGYRCPDHNARVSTTGRTGPHTTGRAVDFGVARADAVELLDTALSLGFFNGYGINQKGPDSGRLIHLDDIRTGPTIWTY